MTTPNPDVQKEAERLAREYGLTTNGDCLSSLTRPGTPVGECIYNMCECDVIKGYQAGYLKAWHAARASAFEELYLRYSHHCEAAAELGSSNAYDGRLLADEIQGLAKLERAKAGNTP